MKHASDRIARQDRPPEVTRVIRIHSVGPTDHFSGAILSDSLYGFWTHWDGRQTRPCWKGQAHCDGCDRELPQRWKGLIELWEMGKPSFFVELTPLAAKEFLERLHGAEMRGVRINVQRERHHRRAPLRIVFLDRYAGQLPKAHDPWATLEVIWGLKR
jgi:hypothetical protein